MNESKAISIWDLSDLCTPWCVHVAATLHIADHVESGKDRIEDLAAAAGCDAYALHQVLGHLVQKGLFEEPSPGRFTLNETARDLLHPMVRSSFDLEDIGGRFAGAWSTMLQYVRTGEPAYHEVFGRPFFDDLDAHPAIAASFDALIGPPGHGTPNPHFEITPGWDAVSTIADVGGGTGAMLAGLLRAHPHLRGILVDRPVTTARAGDIFQSAGVADRVTLVAQSFYDPLPPGADVYLLRGILNDWPDREALAILRRCAEALPPAGRVIVLKSVNPDETPKDITIEVILLGGRHRTLSEFKALARQAGLDVIAAGQQPSGYYVVECCRLTDS